MRIHLPQLERRRRSIYRVCLSVPRCLVLSEWSFFLSFLHAYLSSSSFSFSSSSLLVVVRLRARRLDFLRFVNDVWRSHKKIFAKPRRKLSTRRKEIFQKACIFKFIYLVPIWTPWTETAIRGLSIFSWYFLVFGLVCGVNIAFSYRGLPLSRLGVQ